MPQGAGVRRAGDRRVWITRAQPGAELTAERLRALGHQPLVAPVLEVRRLDAPAPKLDGVAALAFTSANGVRAFAEISGERGLPAFTVGDATAEAARAAGFGRVNSAHGDVGDLARLIGEQGVGEVLHIRGRDAAGDLTGDLRRRGVPTTAAVLYETAPVDALAPEVRAALPTLEAVLVHSPKAGRIVARLLDAPSDRDFLRGLEGLGLSAACVAPLQGLGLRRLCTAAEPNEDALLALLDP